MGRQHDREDDQDHPEMQGTSISENEEVNHHEAGKSKVEANLVRRDGDPD